jgi:hypothetical protein
VGAILLVEKNGRAFFLILFSWWLIVVVVDKRVWRWCLLIQSVVWDIHIGMDRKHNNEQKKLKSAQRKWS